MCLSLVSASPPSHLGHYVGYRLALVYAKYGHAESVCAGGSMHMCVLVLDNRVQDSLGELEGAADDLVLTCKFPAELFVSGSKTRRG